MSEPVLNELDQRPVDDIPNPYRPKLPGMGPALPYGAPSSGQRYVIPDQVKLDETPAAPAAQQGSAQAQPGQSAAVNGWEMYSPDGKKLGTLALDPERTKDYQGYQIQKIGNALVSQATNDGERQAAQRALAFGLSMVGNGNVEDIKKDMVHRYDLDTKGSETFELAKMRHPGARGGGGPVGPTKADKFADQTNKGDAEYEEKIVNNAETTGKLASINEMEKDLDTMEGLMASGRGLQQRVAQAEMLKNLTGKVSVASERLAVQGGAGFLNSLRDRLSLYTSDNPSLTAAYEQEFKRYITTARAALKEKRQELARAAGERIVHSERFANSDEATKKRVRAYAEGTVSGEWPQEEQPPAQSAPTPLSPHLSKYLKK